MGSSIITPKHPIVTKPLTRRSRSSRAGCTGRSSAACWPRTSSCPSRWQPPWALCSWTWFGRGPRRWCRSVASAWSGGGSRSSRGRGAGFGTSSCCCGCCGADAGAACNWGVWRRFWCNCNDHGHTQNFWRRCGYCVSIQFK